MNAPTRTGALGGCLLLLLLTPVPVAPTAAAATYNVSMTASVTFSPASLTVPLGSSVRWTNISNHNHTATSDLGFFNTGYVTPGNSSTKVFPFAGSYSYHCIPHRHLGMTGRVSVTISAPSGDPDRFRVRWATDTASLTGRTFDVHRKPPGGTWTEWARNTKNRYFDTWPSKTGTWQYRVRTDNTSLGTTSGWSPVKYVKVS